MTEHSDRLWTLTQHRADELGLDLQEVASTANVSPQTLYKWRKGGRVTAKLDRRIHAAFEWEYGSQQQVLDGGDPTPVVRSGPPSPPAVFDDPREQAIWSLSALTEEEKIYLIGALRQRDLIARDSATG
ncbi:hypothetical protein [Nocardiopsis sp. NPDC057823]|uniref:hypothetical protein n=1 Tax=Nocardiopsis sp. NPDC057823 TaxID=3346256 RepID=UPI00366E1F1B